MRTSKTVAMVAACIATLIAPLPSANAQPTAQEETVVATYSAAQIAEARALARQRMLDGSEDPAKAADREKFVAVAAEQADVNYHVTDIDIIDIDENLTVIVPADTRITGATVTETEDGTRHADLDTITPQAVAPAATTELQSLGSDWQQVNSGQYVIRLRGAGEMLALWKNFFLTNDGDRNYDYWTHSRKSSAYGYEISGLNWSVTAMEIAGTPTLTTQPFLVNWEDLNPAKSFSSTCDELPFSIGIEVKGVSLSGSFKDCDEYQVSFNSYIPGAYKIRYDQGFIFDTGAREAGYQAAYKTLAGSSVAFDEYQRLEMARWTYPAKTCESTNSNNTCKP